MSKYVSKNTLYDKIQNFVKRIVFSTLVIYTTHANVIVILKVYGYFCKFQETSKAIA